MSLPIVYYGREWGGGIVPSSMVRCITCGRDYAVNPDYDVTEPCPFCKSPIIKAVHHGSFTPDGRAGGIK
jgi:hypothetical protein